MRLEKFTEKAGNPVWIDSASVDVIGTIYTDGTEVGDDPSAEPICYVVLKSGVTVHLDQSAEGVAKRLGFVG